MFVSIKPSGMLNPADMNRPAIIRVMSGDTWVVSLNLYNPVTGRPATPEDTEVEFALSETQFCKPIWTGRWFEGVFVDENRKDLMHVKVPAVITKNLRRGSYMFSVRVNDILRTTYATEATGSFLVEYAPTSECHSIPYRDGTRDSKNTAGENTCNDEGSTWHIQFPSDVYVRNKDTGEYHRLAAKTGRDDSVRLMVEEEGVRQ